MALDTGATYLMVPWHVLEVLRYSPARVRQKISITTASGIEIAPLLTVGPGRQRRREKNRNGSLAGVCWPYANPQIHTSPSSVSATPALWRPPANAATFFSSATRLSGTAFRAQPGLPRRLLR